MKEVEVHVMQSSLVKSTRKTGEGGGVVSIGYGWGEEVT
jgi:hypothetical protein